MKMLYGCIVLCLLLSLALYFHSAYRASPSQQVNGKKLLSLQRELITLRGRVNELEASFRASPKTSLTRTDSLAKPTDKDPVTEGTKQPPQRQTPQELQENKISVANDTPSETIEAESVLEKITAMDNLMLQQEADSEWELNAADEIYAGIESLKFDNALLESTYCSGKICRIEISYQDESDLNKLFEHEKPIVSWPHKGRSYTVDNFGSMRTVMYLTRTD